MSMKELMAAGNSLPTGDTPEGVSFDGTNDYLSRSSDLSGNTDSKTFTFSAWVYSSAFTDYLYGVNEYIGIRVSSGKLSIFAWNPHPTKVFELEGTSNFSIPSGTFSNLICSIDMDNQTGCKVYLNDEAYSISMDTFTTGSNIAFTGGSHNVGAYENSNNYFGRLAHVFLDYTYRDLSTESNRRLFIDSDGKPASGQASLNPILYLPMKDASSAGTNEGTGGDFTVNGVLDTAQRGANQWNCSASKFDGSNDYLSKSGLTGATESKVFTYSASTTKQVMMLPFWMGSGASNKLYTSTQATYLGADGYDAAGNPVFGLSIPIGADIGMVYNVSFAVNIETSTFVAFLNGSNVTSASTLTVHSNANIPFNNSVQIGKYRETGAIYSEGNIGELYFDDSYTDLSTDNPFWDADAGRPKPVRQVISETGTTPLIALPLRGDDAGNNLGTGGDFTVNSGPYTGARGGSEYWARSARASSGYLQRTGSNISTSASKEVTYVFSFKITSTISHSSPHEIDSSNGTIISKQFLEGYKMDIEFTNGSGSNVYRILPNNTGGSSWTAGSWYTVLLSADLTNTANRHFILYKDGVEIQPQSANYSTYTNADIAWDQMYDLQMFRGNGNSLGSGEIFYGNYFLSSSYTDFSQEANRNLFIDQLGYPKDLTPAIDAGTIPAPLIYMKFDDASDLGKNSGSGGDFTVNGTVTAGADVDP